MAQNIELNLRKKFETKHTNTHTRAYLHNTRAFSRPPMGAHTQQPFSNRPPVITTESPSVTNGLQTACSFFLAGSFQFALTMNCCEVVRIVARQGQAWHCHLQWDAPRIQQRCHLTTRRNVPHFHAGEAWQRE
jgi:hypothetical protein